MQDAVTRGSQYLRAYRLRKRLGILEQVPADEPIGLEDPRWLALEFKPEDSAADASTRSAAELEAALESLSVQLNATRRETDTIHAAIARQTVPCTAAAAETQTQHGSLQAGVRVRG